ncbi:SRPBCC family protein [Actinokineospora iranica]|uniref:Polyketide cyclase / dehydrase and lipid transport n=1 Tax=Actinokineospora iranica TaxID=1271860 RepID=A0A1G6JGR3_9PSEU|nr:SRPBCC family protein [Actinokineospora iranica]SDC17881.1 Polyketide cyclase / dehydrase and lipid transport [Actinokineospora iranica]
MKLYEKPLATGEVIVDAGADEVYRVISDPPVMARLGEEIADAQWLDGAGSAAVGVKFKGINRNGRRRWDTICEITDADHGRRFAYEVRTSFRVPISRWQYDIEPVGDGCRVTETNWLRAPLWFLPIAILVTGVLNRIEHNRANIATTLNRLKQHLE